MGRNLTMVGAFLEGCSCNLALCRNSGKWMKFFYNYSSICRIWDLYNKYIPTETQPLSMWPTIYLAANSEPHSFVQSCKVKEWVLCPGKKSILKVRREKKISLFTQTEGKKPIITISKSFQPTKHELRNTKWKKISKLPY